MLPKRDCVSAGRQSRQFGATGRAPAMPALGGMGIVPFERSVCGS